MILEASLVAGNFTFTGTDRRFLPLRPLIVLSKDSFFRTKRTATRLPRRPTRLPVLVPRNRPAPVPTRRPVPAVPRAPPTRARTAFMSNKSVSEVLLLDVKAPPLLPPSPPPWPVSSEFSSLLPFGVSGCGSRVPCDDGARGGMVAPP